MAKVEFNQERCKGCGYCVAKCPKHILEFTGASNQAGYAYPTQTGEGCIGCGICYMMCPDCAITVYQ